jgi:phosphopantothenoylcysteine synthetase/decarboxylase
MMKVNLSERVKTDMRLPRVLIQHVEEMAELVGLPKNAFFTVAAAMMATFLSRQYAPGKRRKKMLDDLEKEVQKVFREARKEL